MAVDLHSLSHSVTHSLTDSQSQRHLTANFRPKIHSFLAVCVLTATALVSTTCESEQKGPIPTGGSVKISGQLITGLATEGVRAGVRGGVRAGQEQGVRAEQQEGVRTSPAHGEPVEPRRQSTFESGKPLADYSLFCVTFQDPPVAGTGTADAGGKFILNIDAAGISFGCFVLDSSDRRVADLLFLDDRVGEDGNHLLNGTAAYVQDSELGEVWVDESTGIALVGRGSRLNNTGQENFDPTGPWKFETCLDPRDNGPCKGQDLIFYSAFVAQFPSIFVNRVLGTDFETGSRRYFLNGWRDKTAFDNCGSNTEGLTRERARDVYGIDLDPEANATPYQYIDYPWDPAGTCVGAVSSDRSNRQECSEVTDKGVQYFCYRTCLDERAEAGEFPCVRGIKNIRLLEEHLKQIEGGLSPVFVPEEYQVETDSAGFSVMAWFAELNPRLAEGVYSAPTTVSITRFTATLAMSRDPAGKGKQCELAGAFKLDLARVADPAVDLALFFSFSVSASSRDYDWCVLNSDSLRNFLNSPVPIGTNLHLRARLRAVP